MSEQFERASYGRTGEKYFFGEKSFSPEQALRVKNVINLCGAGLKRGEGTIGYVPLVKENLKDYIDNGSFLSPDNPSARMRDPALLYFTPTLPHLLPELTVEEQLSEREAIRFARMDANSDGPAIDFLCKIFPSQPNAFSEKMNDVSYLMFYWKNLRRAANLLKRGKRLQYFRDEFQKFTTRNKLSLEMTEKAFRESWNCGGMVASLRAEALADLDINEILSSSEEWDWPIEIRFRSGRMPAEFLGGIKLLGKEEKEYVAALKKWQKRYGKG